MLPNVFPVRFPGKRMTGTVHLNVTFCVHTPATFPIPMLSPGYGGIRIKKLSGFPLPPQKILHMPSVGSNSLGH